MNQSNQISVPHGAKMLGEKSWTAYVETLISSSVALFIALTVIWPISSVAAVALVFIIALLFAVQVLSLRSVELYYDQDGVWVYSGIFPWTRGVSGVKWRDLEEAVFFQSFGSWVCNSYTLRISHRFTRTNEILLSHWNRGNDVVTTINRQHQKIIRC